MPRFLRPAWALLSILASSALVVPLVVQAAQPSIDAPARLGGLVGAERLDPPEATDPLATASRQVVDLVNAERAQRGLAPLRFDSRLATAAERHAQDQAARRQMSHQGSDGSDAGVRIRRAGYVWSAWAENIAYGHVSPGSVVNAWMNSSGHRLNILSTTLTDTGVGVAVGPDGRYYWTQVFASPG